MSFGEIARKALGEVTVLVHKINRPCGAKEGAWSGNEKEVNCAACSNLDDELNLLRTIRDEQGKRILELHAMLAEAKEVLEFYADGFKIMDHIEGTYTINETWYEKARSLLNRWGRK